MGALASGSWSCRNLSVPLKGNTETHFTHPDRIFKSLMHVLWYMRMSALQYVGLSTLLTTAVGQAFELFGLQYTTRHIVAHFVSCSAHQRVT